VVVGVTRVLRDAQTAELNAACGARGEEAAHAWVFRREKLDPDTDAVALRRLDESRDGARDCAPVRPLHRSGAIHHDVHVEGQLLAAVGIRSAGVSPRAPARAAPAVGIDERTTEAITAVAGSA